MKNNNKNRKLNFIRIKNDLRLGRIKFYCSEKVSNVLKEETLSEHYIQRLLETAKKSLYKNYKLCLGKIEIKLLGYCDEDFIKDLHTNLIILSRGQGVEISKRS